MINRFKKLWKLSRKNSKDIESLTNERIDGLPDEGDGKAIYFGEGSSDEFSDLQKEENGLAEWYERMKKL